MDDEAEGIRAQFPLSFGKQSKSQTPLELVHNATRRTTGAAATSTATNDKPSASKKTTAAFPSLSSSSQNWINPFRNSNPRKSSANGDGDKLVGPPNPPEGSEDEDERTIGPPRPPPGSGSVGDEDEEPLIGPPRPPPGNAEDGDDDGPVIGPPKPPLGVLDSDSDEDADADEEDDDSGYRLPMSNEIILKGHTKDLEFYLAAMTILFACMIFKA